MLLEGVSELVLLEVSGRLAAVLQHSLIQLLYLVHVATLRVTKGELVIVTILRVLSLLLALILLVWVDRVVEVIAVVRVFVAAVYVQLLHVLLKLVNVVAAFSRYCPLLGLLVEGHVIWLVARGHLRVRIAYGKSVR